MVNDHVVSLTARYRLLVKVLSGIKTFTGATDSWRPCYRTCSNSL